MIIVCMNRTQLARGVVPLSAKQDNLVLTHRVISLCTDTPEIVDTTQQPAEQYPAALRLVNNVARAVVHYCAYTQLSRIEAVYFAACMRQLHNGID